MRKLTVTRSVEKPNYYAIVNMGVNPPQACFEGMTTDDLKEIRDAICTWIGVPSPDEIKSLNARYEFGQARNSARAGAVSQ